MSDVDDILDGLALWEEHRPQSADDWIAVAGRVLDAGDDGSAGSPIFHALCKVVAEQRKRAADGEVTLAYDRATARAIWHSIAIAVQLLDELDVPPDAPLYGQRDALLAAARALDHELNCGQDGNG